MSYSHLAKLLAASVVLLFVTCAEAQGTFTAETGYSRTRGQNVRNGLYVSSASRDESGQYAGALSYAIDLAFGYTLDNGLGVRALAIVGETPFGRRQTPERSFNQFWGVQATGTTALTQTVNLRGGVGVGETTLDKGPSVDTKLTADGVVSLGVQWRPARHFAMELRADHLTASNVTSIGLLFQVPF